MSLGFSVGFELVNCIQIGGYGVGYIAFADCVAIGGVLAVKAVGDFAHASAAGQQGFEAEDALAYPWGFGVGVALAGGAGLGCWFDLQGAAAALGMRAMRFTA